MKLAIVICILREKQNFAAWFFSLWKLHRIINFLCLEHHIERKHAQFSQLKKRNNFCFKKCILHLFHILLSAYYHRFQSNRYWPECIILTEGEVDTHFLVNIVKSIIPLKIHYRMGKKVVQIFTIYDKFSLYLIIEREKKLEMS